MKKNFTNRIYILIKNIFFKFSKKSFFFNLKKIDKYFLAAACSLYFGFVIGNLFGTFLIFLRNTIIWDGMSLIFIILFLEIINSIIYNIKLKKKRFLFFLILRNFQIGLLLGFFIDAFKVGS